jgi:hypothetical protein
MKNIWGNGMLDEIAVFIIGIGSIILCAVGKITNEQTIYVWCVLLAYIFGRGREIVKRNGKNGNGKNDTKQKHIGD